MKSVETTIMAERLLMMVMMVMVIVTALDDDNTNMSTPSLSAGNLHPEGITDLVEEEKKEEEEEVINGNKMNMIMGRPESITIIPEHEWNIAKMEEEEKERRKERRRNRRNRGRRRKWKKNKNGKKFYRGNRTYKWGSKKNLKSGGGMQTRQRQSSTSPNQREY